MRSLCRQLSGIRPPGCRHCSASNGRSADRRYSIRGNRGGVPHGPSLIHCRTISHASTRHGKLSGLLRRRSRIVPGELRQHYAGYTVQDCAGARPCNPLDDAAPVIARGRLRQSHCGGSIAPDRLRQIDCGRSIAPEDAVIFSRGPAAPAKLSQNPVLAQVSGVVTSSAPPVTTRLPQGIAAGLRPYIGAGVRSAEPAG